MIAIARFALVLVVLVSCGGETASDGEPPALPPLCNLHDHCGETCLGKQESPTSWRPGCQCPNAAEVAPLTTVCEVCGEDYTCACMQAADPALQKWRCTDAPGWPNPGDTAPLFEQP